MTTPATAARLRFGRYELQAHERRLLKNGEPVALGARAFDVLLALAERPGLLVDKRTLMELVWPGVVVQENNLAAQVSALRKALGDEVIATIPGRGYRFVARLESPLPQKTDAAVPHAPAAASEPGAGKPALRTNLPVEPPVLLGRADDLAALGALLDGHRLVSVVGAGGIGKSLLAQHLLLGRRNAYPQGVCWVELATVADPTALPGAIAAALDVDCGHGEPAEALIGAVAPLAMLLALDNAEHLLADVAHLCRAMLDAAAGLRIVVTSQAPLRLADERVFRIEPLAVPEAALPAAQAQHYASVTLFTERAQAADRRFALTDANAAAVIEICRALDGLPLAIELAAARAPMLGVQQLAASMRDRLALLTASRNRAAPRRQQALRATLQWSHDLLGEREQRVFRRLAVFSGSASLTLIEQVLSDVDESGELDRWAVLDALDVLVDRSLVVVQSAAGDGEPRYLLLESPHAYALERLDAAGERPVLQRRHARAVAAMLDAACEEYFSGRVGVDDWLRRREADFDNARDALHWARGTGETGVELLVGATLLRALPPSLHAERMALADACEALLGPAVPEPLQLRVWIELSCVLADTQKARGRHAALRAVELTRRLDDSPEHRFVRYHALCRAASAAAQAADLGSARQLIDELQPLEDPAWPAQRRVWGAEAAQWYARMSGDVAEALHRGRVLLALDRQRGSYAAIATGNLIDAELASGDAQAAARTGLALVETLQGTRHEYSLAFARINLLAALLALDDCARARPVAQSAWARAAAFDLQHASAAYLALLAALEGRPRAAARLIGYSEAIYAARAEAREANETGATDRARALAVGALGEREVDRLRAEGERLRDEQVADLAFGSNDS